MSILAACTTVKASHDLFITNDNNYVKQNSLCRFLQQWFMLVMKGVNEILSVAINKQMMSYKHEINHESHKPIKMSEYKFNQCIMLIFSWHVNVVIDINGYDKLCGYNNMVLLLF